MNEELNRLYGDKHLPLGEVFKRAVKYFKPEWWRFLIVFVLIILQVGCSTVMPLITAQITNTLKSDNLVQTSLVSIIMFALSYLGIALIQQALHYFNAITLSKAGQNIVFKLRMEVFEHIEHMSSNQLNMMPVGALVTRVASYTASISDLFTNVLVNVVSSMLTIVAVYIVMLCISWRLSLLLLIVVFIIFVASFVFGKVVRKLFNKIRIDESRMNTFLNESLSGMKIIQFFNQEERQHNDFSGRNEAIRKDNFHIHVAFGIYRPLISLLYISSYALIFWMGLRTNLNAGEIVAFYLLVGNFFSPVEQLADQLNNLQRALSGTEKLFNLLDVKPDVLDKEGAQEIDHFKGKIEFKNVWFAYNEGEWILKDVSFVVNPGDTCAFVGATGAGKTTILSLIVRNFEIQKGQILIDDIDIQDIKIQSLRKAIGQMLQDVFLFSGTIRTNITLYDDESYSDEEINQVVKYVNADKFIDRLPNKLDEKVIERGENFSVGQRQLLSFARTVLAKPQILILDEATANIDTETEVLIQESLHKIKELGTMLVVAHRLSTIQHADNIVVLNHGEVVEQGNHQQLLKNKGLYYKLYQLQFDDRNQ